MGEGDSGQRSLFPPFSFHYDMLHEGSHLPSPPLFHRPPKGHEDLRQDERVMQLFGLVNTMLANDRTTSERDLSIARCEGCRNNNRSEVVS